jgi:hypothetical protein
VVRDQWHSILPCWCKLSWPSVWLQVCRLYCRRKGRMSKIQRLDSLPWAHQRMNWKPRLKLACDTYRCYQCVCFHSGMVCEIRPPPLGATMDMKYDAISLFLMSIRVLNSTTDPGAERRAANTSLFAATTSHLPMAWVRLLITIVADQGQTR